MKINLLSAVLVWGFVMATCSAGWAQWNTADPGQTSKQAHRGLFGDRRMGVPLESPTSRFGSGLQRGPSGDFYGRAPVDRPLMFSPRLSQSPLLPPLNQQQLSGTQALAFSQFLDQQQRIQYPGQLYDQMQFLLDTQQDIAGSYRLQQNTLTRIQQQELPEQRLQQLQQQLQQLQQQQAQQENQLALQQQVADLAQQIAQQQQAIIQAQQAALEASEQQRAALQAAQQQQQPATPPQQGEVGQPPAAPEQGGAAAPEIWFRGTPATAAPGAPGAATTPAPPALPAPSMPAATNIRPTTQYMAGFSAPSPVTDVRARALSRRISTMPGLHTRSPIAVSITNGTATLRGTVASSHDRQMAELTTLLEPGVDRVDNQLVVQP
jgi:hypothetical protein